MRLHVHVPLQKLYDEFVSWSVSFVFLCAGFVAGNYARVLSGPHEGLQGKVGTHMCMCMCMYMYMYMCTMMYMYL